MQEVLSKTLDPKAPLRDQQFYELRLYDSKSAGLAVYCVREARAWWNDEAGEVVWDDEQVQTFATRREAPEHYATRRQVLAEKGFLYSDLDL